MRRRQACDFIAGPFLSDSPGLMAISMRLYLAPDSDLRAFGGAPRTLRVWLRYPRAIPDVSLDGHWQDLDAILAAEPSVDSKAPLRPQGADWTYPFVADHGAHALSSTSIEHLLHSIAQVGRPQVEAYVQRRWESRARQAGQSADLAAVQLSAETEELLLYLARLREVCALAVGKGYGMLMVLWGKS